jgi:hypothetical protein
MLPACLERSRRMPPACPERSPRMLPVQTGGSLEDHWRITGRLLESSWADPGLIQAHPWRFTGLSLEASSCHTGNILERQRDITGTASRRSGSLFEGRHHGRATERRATAVKLRGHARQLSISVSVIILSTGRWLPAINLSWDCGPFNAGFLTSKKQTCNSVFDGAA